MSANDTLAQQIADLQEQMLPGIPEETLNVLMKTTGELVGRGIAERALHAGDICPDFSLPNAAGGETSLAEKLASGPLVLSFYRGAWCPYCNLEIRALAAHADRFRQQDADLVAISPQVPGRAEQQSTALELDFDVLSDAGNEVARRFGLVFALASEAQPIYDAFGFDLPGHNGDDRYEMPIPATYIIGSDRKILYAFVDADYTRRLEPSVILDQLRKIRDSRVPRSA